MLTATKNVGNSNKTIGKSIFANTEASIAKSGKNVMGFVESKALLLTVLLTAISPSLIIFQIKSVITNRFSNMNNVKK